MVSLSYNIYKRNMPTKLSVFFILPMKLVPLGLGLQVGAMFIPVSARIWSTGGIKTDREKVKYLEKTFQWNLVYHM
jgi:hypothetical protein